MATDMGMVMVMATATIMADMANMKRPPKTSASQNNHGIAYYNFP
jgi:hypothetical protein